jgi:cytosine deaminase
MLRDLLITDVRPWGGAAADLHVQAGRIAAIAPVGQSTDLPGARLVVGGGRIIVPSFADVHVHLDSTRLGMPWRPNDTPAGLWQIIMHERAHWRSAEWPMQARSEFLLGQMIQHGTTRLRGYAQVDADAKLERLEAVLAARETHRHRARIDIIAFPQAGLLRESGVPELMEEALRQGADVMGGIDPCALDGDPVRHLDIVFDTAEKFGVPIDFHLHEAGELGLFTLGLIIERTRALDLRGRVTISHAFTLAHTAAAEIDPVIEQLAELDISVATVAPAGRNTLPLLKLTAAGVRVGLGEDGQRDYWSPFGNGDMLDRAWQLAFTNGFRNDRLVEHCVAVATHGGMSVIDPAVVRLSGPDDRPGIAVGEPADLVVLEGETVASAVMDRLPGRTVIHDGRVVADNLQVV